MFSEIIILLWLAFLIYWFISATTAKRTIKRNHWWFGLGGRVILLAIVILALRIPALENFFSHAYYSSFTTNIGLEIAGVIVCIIGMAIAVWARIYLGRNWGMPMSVKENPKLVTTGPYRWVRHPIYSGFLLAVLGSVLVDGILSILLVIYLIYFMYSAKKEEQIMSKEFPNEYPDYMRRTKMIIPFLL